MKESTWQAWRAFWDRHPIMGGVLVTPVLLGMVVAHVVVRWWRRWFQFE